MFMFQKLSSQGDSPKIPIYADEWANKKKSPSVIYLADVKISDYERNSFAVDGR